MCRVFVDHELDWSSPILLYLEPRDAVMWWSLGIEVAHLHQKRHCDLLVGYEVDVYRTAIRNPKVNKKADRVIRYDCAEGRFALWRLVKAC
jgi:hypothetical protein